MKPVGQASVRLTKKGRLRAIERIMEARFMAATYSQALRERERLVEASNAQLCAELANLPS